MKTVEQNLEEADRLLELAEERAEDYDPGDIQSLAFRARAHVALAEAIRRLGVG